MRLDAAAHGGAATVLLAEDDDDARNAFANWLRDAGFGVAEARNGAEAIDLLRARADIAVIVLDLMMPILDGWEFLDAYRREPAWARIPTIVLSEIPANHPACANLPVSVYCAKPFQFDYLIGLIGELAPTPGA